MIAVWVATAIVPGVDYKDWQSLMIAALVLGILNSLVKPILKIVSIPFIIMTFGLFLLVINAIMLRMTAWLVGPGFHVDGFCPAIGASLVISIVSMFLGYNKTTRRSTRQTVENSFEPPFPPRNTRNGPPPGTGPIIDV